MIKVNKFVISKLIKPVIQNKKFLLWGSMERMPEDNIRTERYFIERCGEDGQPIWEEEQD